MKNKTKIFYSLLFALLVCLAGCHMFTTSEDVNKVMNSWLDHDSNELIAKWGFPTKQMGDGRGGKILHYEFTYSYTSDGYSTTTFDNFGNAHTTHSPSTTSHHTKTRTFWINSEGKVYNWAWRGL